MSMALPRILMNTCLHSILFLEKVGSIKIAISNIDKNIVCKVTLFLKCSHFEIELKIPT